MPTDPRKSFRCIVEMGKTRLPYVMIGKKLTIPSSEQSYGEDVACWKEREERVKHRFILSVMVVLLLAVLAACGGSSDNTNQVIVSLSDFKIQSSQTTFTAGETYHFTVTNNGQTIHEFMIMPPMSGKIPMSQMDQMALYHIEESDLPPGASKSFDYTFPSSLVHKPLEFACHLPAHYEAGQHETISVTAS